jgi:hypothetical protein
MAEQTVETPKVEAVSSEPAVLPAELPVKRPKKPRGKPFQKGNDPRRNRSGNPIRAALDLKQVALKVLESEVKNRMDGKMYPVTEAILMDWAVSGEFNKQKTLLEIG